MSTEFIYDFQFEDGSKRSYTLQLSDKTGFILSNIDESQLPEWTHLSYKKCKDCPLDESKHQYCPVAKNLSPYLEEYKDQKSYVKVHVRVTSEERFYEKKTSLQDGLYSFFGIVFATSSCPNMDFLRPMARFHLPFSNVDETIVRSLGFYLLKQYFNMKDGEEADFELKHFEEAYRKVIRVNKDFVERIHSIGSGDAESNSIIALDGFAQLLHLQLEQDLPDIRELF